MVNTPLKQQLVLLYQLQERDLGLLSIHHKLQAIPGQIDQLEPGIAKCEADVAAKSVEIAEKEKMQRAENAKIEMNVVQRKKYQAEQRTVTSNEAYMALERQIEFLNQKDAEAEDAHLQLMEETDHLKSEFAELQAAAERQKEKITNDIEHLQQELLGLETQRDEQLKQRKTLLPKIDKVYRDQYHRWMKAQLASQVGAARSKIGFVALGKDGTCSSCRIAIQPQTLKEAQKYQKPVYCSSCNRLLYVEPATSEVPFP